MRPERRSGRLGYAFATLMIVTAVVAIIRAKATAGANKISIP